MEKRVKEGTIKVTVPLHRSLKRKTLQMILKQAGLSVEEFLKLL